MKTNNKILFSIIVILFVGVCKAQTTNTGEFYITLGTQFSTISDFNNTASGEFINDGEAFIYAHFNNDGIVDFTNEGYTRFEGNAIQQLTGGTTSYFYDILFDNNSSNTASFELSNEINIEGEANFEEGIVKNDDFGGSITFEDDATHTGVYDGSHVDGPVGKNGDDSFIYPIGDAQWFRYAAISAPENTTDFFTAKYFFENPDSNYPLASKAGVIELIDNQEYWTITKDASLDNSNILLTLSWDETTTTPSEIVASPQSAIRIIRWDDTQQLWVNEGGLVDEANKTVTTPLKLENYGVFTLGRIDEGIVLPGGDIVIYNGVTPNDDDKNDYFFIDGIQTLPNNNVQIYNRWGVLVFETNDYDSNGNIFKGYSEGRLTINNTEKLPTDTYFYVLSYDYTNKGSTERMKKAGYLYLTTD